MTTAFLGNLVKAGMWKGLADLLVNSPSFATPAFTLKTATVAAAGTNQATAAALTASTAHLVTGADDTKGVVLPAAAPGTWVIIKVGDGADLKVYPASGDKINALSTDAALTVVDDVSFLMWALNSEQWYTMPLLPS